MVKNSPSANQHYFFFQHSRHYSSLSHFLSDFEQVNPQMNAENIIHVLGCFFFNDIFDMGIQEFTQESFASSLFEQSLSNQCHCFCKTLWIYVLNTVTNTKLISEVNTTKHTFFWGCLVGKLVCFFNFVVADRKRIPKFFHIANVNYIFLGEIVCKLKLPFNTPLPCGAQTPF